MRLGIPATAGEAGRESFKFFGLAHRFGLVAAGFARAYSLAL